MKTYMVMIQLLTDLTVGYISLIPNQQTRILELMDKGIILQYALTSDHSTLWVTVLAKTLKKAKKIISSFPLINYMKMQFFELAFQNSINIELPKILMN